VALGPYRNPAGRAYGPDVPEEQTIEEVTLTGSRIRPARGSGVGRVAVVLATFVVVAVLVSYTILFVALAAGGDDAISDTWVGFQAAFVLLGGLLLSLVAFVMAIVARVRHERSTLLRLPMALFPTLMVLLVLAELFVIE
jgi:hypothetical protein